MQDYSLEQLAQFVPTKGALYRIMVLSQKYFLPAETSKAITEAYLVGVLKGEYFSLKQDEKKELFLKDDFSVGKLELIEEISKKTDKRLGFSINASPDKNWLLDVLNTLDPDNKLLKGDPSLMFTRELPENMFENLVFPLTNAKRQGIFKKTKEEKEAIRLARKKKVYNKKINRAMLLKKFLEEEEMKGSQIREEIEELEKETQKEKDEIPPTATVTGQDIEEQAIFHSS